MSENSPRWPGRNGSPGLDFSPYRKTDDEKAEPAEVSAKSAAAKSDDTQVSQAAKGPAEAPKTRSTVSERAANTAKEWAAVPVSGMPATARTAEQEDKPSHPSTPSRPDPKPVVKAEPKTTEKVEAKPDSATLTPNTRSRRTRKARLRLSRIDPWSVMKTTFLFSIAFGIMLVVATFVIWSVLAGSGAMESVNTLVNTVLGDAENPENSFRLEDYLSSSRVLGFAAVLAAIDVVIITAVATLFAFLYNLAATVMGGLEVTLAED